MNLSFELDLNLRSIHILNHFTTVTIIFQCCGADDVLFVAQEMDQADDELKETIKLIWPLQAKNMIDLLVPKKDELNTGKMTIGKIYGGLLILESWRSTRFGQIEPAGGAVSYNSLILSKLSLPFLLILLLF